MLSKRDKLLSRPWQQRRYESHRRKVQSALPAIDVGPPVQRGHVCYKSKKKQSEKERCLQIEQDNLRLLQKMESIMKKNRLDNSWATPQPNFLHRVGLYSTFDGRSMTTISYKTLNSLSPISTENLHDSYRNSRCTACHPSKEQLPEFDSERLLPWEEDPPKMSQYLTVNKQKNKLDSGRCWDDEDKSNVDKTKINSKTNNNVSMLKTPYLILNRGNLKLYVNFPSDSEVKLCDGNKKKEVFKNMCGCKGYKNN